MLLMVITMNRIWNETTYKVKQRLEEDIRSIHEEELLVMRRKLKAYETYKSFLDKRTNQWQRFHLEQRSQYYP